MFDHGVELRASSLAMTERVAAAVGEHVRPGDIVVLAGEMGAGKTAFAQGVARALGVVEPVTSPTFTLVHSYDVPPEAARGRLTLHHADLYRLDRTAEVADLALNELAEDRGVVLVEWGDVVDGMFDDHLTVYLEQDPDDETDELALDRARLIEVSGVGASWASRWELLRHRLEPFAC